MEDARSEPAREERHERVEGFLERLHDARFPEAREQHDIEVLGYEEAHPIVQASVRLAQTLGLTSPEKRLRRRRQELEELVRSAQSTVYQMEQQLDGLNHTYDAQQQIRDESFEVYEILQQEITDARMEISQVQGRYEACTNADERARLRAAYREKTSYVHELERKKTELNFEIKRNRCMLQAMKGDIEDMTDIIDESTRMVYELGYEALTQTTSSLDIGERLQQIGEVGEGMERISAKYVTEVGTFNGARTKRRASIASLSGSSPRYRQDATSHQATRQKMEALDRETQEYISQVASQSIDAL